MAEEDLLPNGGRLAEQQLLCLRRTILWLSAGTFRRYGNFFNWLKILLFSFEIEMINDFQFVFINQLSSLVLTIQVDFYILPPVN